MSTLSTDATTEQPETLRGRLGVPWLTVVPLAGVLAYADGFWMISLRGAAGAIERTGEPFASWVRESTLTLPLFILAVLGALTLAARWFGPVLRKPKTVVATALMIVAAGTLVGVAELAASSAYDYHLQSSQLQVMGSMRSMSGMESMGSTAQQQQASLELQVRAVGLGSALLLVTNLVLVSGTVAFRGGRLDISTTRPKAAGALAQPGPRGQGDDESARHRGAAGTLRDRIHAAQETATLATHSTPRSRADDLRLLLAAALFGSAAIHAAVVPEHLTEWLAAGVFFIVLTAAELAVAALLLARPRQPRVLLAAAVASVGPLAVWLYSRTLGMPFGPEAGVPEQVGLADSAACVLEVITLLLAVVLLRQRGRLRRASLSAHVRGLCVVTVLAVTTIGLLGSGLAWFDAFGSSGDQSVTSPHTH